MSHILGYRYRKHKVYLQNVPTIPCYCRSVALNWILHTHFSVVCIVCCVERADPPRARAIKTIKFTYQEMMI